MALLSLSSGYSGLDLELFGFTTRVKTKKSTLNGVKIFFKAHIHIHKTDRQSSVWGDKMDKEELGREIARYKARLAERQNELDRVRRIGEDDDGNSIEYWEREVSNAKERLETLESELAVANVTYKAGKDIVEHAKELLAVVVEPERKKMLQAFVNCVLPQEVKDGIEEALSTRMNAGKFVEWGINDNFEKGLTNSMLLHGMPGTGKTMITEAMAAVLGKNLMVLGSGEIQSNVPGQTERNVKEAFKKAKENNAVLLFDECDSILSDRNSVGVIMGAEINAVLTELERFDGEVFLTTNRLHRLDPALQRRIVSKIELGMPTQEAREQIWTNLIPDKMPLGKDVDVKKLAEPELTGGEIKNAILVAARKAIAKNRDEVSFDLFENAVNSVLKAKDDYARTRPKRVE